MANSLETRLIINQLVKIKCFIIGAIALAYCQNAISQVNNPYISLDLGLKYDPYQVSNYAGDNEFIQKPWFPFPALGLSAGADIDDFSLEMGIDFHQYSYMIHGRNFGSATNGFWVMQVPFRLKYDILKKSTKWDWNVGISYNLGFILDNSEGLLEAEDRANFSSYGTTIINGAVVDSTASGMLGSFDGQNKVYHLLGFRTELQYNIGSVLGVFIGANRLTGFRKIAEIDAVFQKNTDPIDRARYTSNGDYFKIFFGLRFFIGSDS